MLEPHSMKDNPPGKVDEEAALILVHGEEESTVGRGCEMTDIGRGLNWERNRFEFVKVCDGDAVTDGGDKKLVLNHDGIAAAVRGTKEILEGVVHGGAPGFC